MEFDVLGPLAVRRGDQPIAIPGAKQRVLLAALLVHAGEVVSGDRLAEILWGDDQPANPRNALQSQVSQLRRLLGPDGRELLVSRPTGYAIEVGPHALDAHRFEAAVRDGRQALAGHDVAAAAARLREALELWRGPALAEFAGHGFADATISKLEELRLGAIEDRIDADLACGRHSELVPELEALVAEHPLRERLRGQLMLALYRAGRQADALQVYHDTRAVLDEELGLDPGPELTRRYEDLLRQQDDAPASPTTTAAGAVAGPSVIAGASSRTAAPPPRLPSAAPPAQLSSFVGREDELGRVLGLLRSSRLVTLTGPGGVGKTRLAIEAAIALHDDALARDGIWFVELASVSDPELVAAEVAARLGLNEEAAGVAGTLGGGRDAAERLTDALRHRQALLVLDNCEHLVDAVAAFSADLLAAASRLTVMCTTREALGVTGETVWSVPSLTVPTVSAPGPDELLRWGAARLFIDRVGALDPSFVVDATGAAAVADICRRLDGIPLALELAAARVRALGVEELAARLDDRFRILTGGDRTARPRQRTLRAVVEWSWELLDERERALFRRMAVFSAGSPLDGLEEVCSDDAGLVREEVLDVLAGLVDKSVVLLDRSERPSRYRMLETLRAYGLEQLDAAGEAADVRGRHADRMLTYAGSQVPELRGRDQVAVMRAIDAAQPDLRAALHWLEESGDTGTGARLAGELGWYWYLKGARHEALRWLSSFEVTADRRDRAVVTVWRAFLSLGFGPTEPLRAEVEAAAEQLLEHGTERDVALSQLVAGDIAAVLGDREVQESRLARARQAAERIQDEGFLATADFVDGHGHVAAGRFRAAEPWMQAAYERFARIGDRWGQVQCLMALVGVAESLGDVTRAAERGRRGLELAAELGLREMEGILHARVATFHALTEEFDEAWRSIDRLRVVVEELGSDIVAANLDLACGIVALREGELDRGEEHLHRLLTRLDRMPHGSIRAETIARLGVVAEHRGNLDRARELHAEAVGMALDLQEPRSTAFTLEAAAATLAAAGDAEDAAILLGAADARRRAIGLPLPDIERRDVDRTAARARTTLGDGTFEAALARGAELADTELPFPSMGATGETG